jgi:hypothetical protein
MATVTRVEGPSVAPDALPGVRLTAHLDPNASAGLERGIADLGAGFGHFAQVEQDKADSAAVLEAQRKLGDWERSWFDPNNPTGVYASKGRDARGLADAVAPDFERVSSELAGSLKSERARQAFTEHAYNVRESVLNRVNNYAVNENDQYVAAEFKASLVNNAEGAAQAALDGRWDDQARLVRDGLRTINAQAVVAGQSPEVTHTQTDAFLSSVHATAINGLLARGETDRAMAYFNANAEDISASAAGDLMAKMKPLLEAKAAYDFVDGVQSGNVTAESTGAHLTLDQLWPAQTHQESPTGQYKDGRLVVSPKGAVGGAQVMPDTGPVAAKMAGVPWDAELFNYQPSKANPDPVMEAKAAAYNDLLGKSYMQAQLITFGSAPLALAAYNAGPGRVFAWLKQYGDPRKGEITTAEWVAKIPVSETRNYVQTISARAGAPVDTAVTAGPGPNASLSDQLAATKGFPVEMRSKIDGLIIQRHSVQEQDRQDADRQAQQAIFAAVNTMDPRGNLISALSPDQYAFAAQHNQLLDLQEILNKRAGGQPIVSDFDTLSSFQQVIDRAAVSPAARAGLATLNPYDPKLTLAPEDRAKLQQQINVLQSKDEKKLAVAASEAEVSRVITQYRVQQLKLTDDAIKSSNDAPDSPRAQAIAFDQSMRTWVSQFASANGRQPTYTEVTKQADALTFSVPVVKKGWVWDSETTKPALAVKSIDDIPPRFRTDITQRLAAGGYPPTEANVLRYYKDGVAQGLFK